MRTTKRFTATLALAAGLGLGLNSAQAGITAGFDGGAGTTLVDQYEGIAGDGWSTPWSATSGATAAVANTTQLNGGGNYVSTTTSTASGRGLKRTYTAFDGIDLSQVHIIQFDWRFDRNIAHFASNSDRLYIADGSGGGSGESGATAFHIRAHGADRGAADGGEWAIYNGAKDSAIEIDDSQWVNSGMSFQADVVYSFTVTVDPVNRTYDVNIDNGTIDVTVNDMGFWTSNTSVAGTLNFMSRKSTGVDDLSYSIDSLSITVPEPGSMALIGMGAALMLVRSRRKGD